MSSPSRRTLLWRTASAAVVLGCGRALTGCGTIASSDASPTGPTAPTDRVVDSGDPACDPTGADIEGPFWVDGVPVRSDLDVYGEKGPRLAFGGQVIDAVTCAPIGGAVVEIWHADTAGAYDNDAAGRYRGQIASDAGGAYAFTTVVPGRYLNGPTYRPAHVHVKVWVDGVERLTTQLYFDHDPFSDGDPWFDPERVVADLDDGDMLTGTFDLIV